MVKKLTLPSINPNTWKLLFSILAFGVGLWCFKRGIFVFWNTILIVGIFSQSYWSIFKERGTYPRFSWWLLVFGFGFYGFASGSWVPVLLGTILYAFERVHYAFSFLEERYKHDIFIVVLGFFLSWGVFQYTNTLIGKFIIVSVILFFLFFEWLDVIPTLTPLKKKIVSASAVLLSLEFLTIGMFLPLSFPLLFGFLWMILIGFREIFLAFFEQRFHKLVLWHWGAIFFSFLLFVFFLIPWRI